LSGKRKKRVGKSGREEDRTHEEKNVKKEEIIKEVSE
jgi:hypothetical protein